MHARRIFVWLLLASAFVLPSCIPLDNPLSEPEKAKPDARLFGAWKGVDAKSGDILLLVIGKSGLEGAPSGIMQMVTTELGTENRIKTGSWYFFPTALGNNNYMNFMLFAGSDQDKPSTWEKRKIQGYFLFKYTVQADKLTFWSGDSKAVEAVIRKGALKGTIGKKIPQEKLAGGEELAKFLAAGGDKLFFPAKEDYQIELTRIK